MFATRIDPEVLKELKHLSVDTECPISDLMEEAVRDLLEKLNDEADKWLFDFP